MDKDRIAQNLAAVENHFHSEALNEVETALETFTDDIVWEAPAPNGLHRSFSGKEAAAKNYRELFASMRDVKFQFLNIARLFHDASHRRYCMAISKETKSLNMPWEQEYGYSQAVKVGDTIYLSGQVSHDDQGNIVGRGDMEMQMRQAYANVQKVLAQYGATMANIVDEVLFVTDMEAAFAAAVKCRPAVFSGTPVVASTIVQIQRLASPEFMIEIKCVAKV